MSIYEIMQFMKLCNLCKYSNHKIMEICKSWNYANYSNYAVGANCRKETNYANFAINQILQIGQISISDGQSTVVQVDWTDGIGMDLRMGWGTEHLYGAT